jgi:hypothetical protein
VELISKIFQVKWNDTKSRAEPKSKKKKYRWLLKKAIIHVEMKKFYRFGDSYNKSYMLFVFAF